MGLGDWVIATASAEVVAQTGKKAVFGDRKRAYWSEVFENNPNIAREPSRDTTWVEDYNGNRPYILGHKNGQFTFNSFFRVPYGRIYLTDEEREWARSKVSGDYIVVEPDIKDDGTALCIGKNKAWNKWDQLLKLDYPWLQLGVKTPKTRQVMTPKFRQALAVLAGAKLFVGTDGALHHAAAALGVPGVVLWGGLVSPKVLGYPTHTNVWNGAQPCGTFNRLCPHCREAMDSITLDQVKRHL